MNCKKTTFLNQTALVMKLTFDKFLGIEVNIPATDGESTVIGKVTKRKRDHDNALIGQYNENPILNTALYQVETPDGNIHEYTANRIAEHVWNQVDDDGWDYNVLYDIIGHRKESDAEPKENGYTTTTSGTRKRVITTKGWLIKVKWESGETSFVPLKVIKLQRWRSIQSVLVLTMNQPSHGGADKQ